MLGELFSCLCLTCFKTGPCLVCLGCEWMGLKVPSLLHQSYTIDLPCYCETYSYPYVCHLLHEKLLQNVNTSYHWCSCWLSTFILLFCGFILLCYVLDEPSELRWPDVHSPPPPPTPNRKRLWWGWGGTEAETRELIPIVST